MADVLSDKIRTARTPKKCFACYLPIRPGDRYHDQRCAFDGCVYAWPHHCFCAWLIHKHIAEHYIWEDGIPEGCVAESEIGQWYSSDPLAGFANFVIWLSYWAEYASEASQ